MHKKGTDMRVNEIRVDLPEDGWVCLEDIGLEVVEEATCMTCGEDFEVGCHVCPELARLAVCGDACPD